MKNQRKPSDLMEYVLCMANQYWDAANMIEMLGLYMGIQDITDV